MASRPSKRQKRTAVLSSEDDEESIAAEKHARRIDGSGSGVEPLKKKNDHKSAKTLPSRPRPQTRSTSLRSCPSATAPENPSPVPKTLTRRKVRGQNNGNSKSLHAFLTDPTSSQQSQLGIQRMGETVNLAIERDDIIEDDSQDDGYSKLSSSQHAMASVLDPKDRHRGSPQNRAVSSRVDKLPRANQKFMTQKRDSENASSREAACASSYIDPRPWVEIYGPVDVEELAVHRKKVADIRVWLENVWSGRDYKRMLILKGPSGAGKTATISSLCSAMNIDILEWKNPLDAEFSSEAYVSVSSQFSDFLGRSGKFNSLDFVSNSFNDFSEPSVIKKQPGMSRRKIILVEEFPNIFNSNAATLRLFRSVVMNFLSASWLYSKGSSTSISLAHEFLPENISPMVMIMTESHFSSTSSAYDTFNAHRLLGPDILNHPSVSVIEFNPIAPTYMTKALDLVVKKEARRSGRRRIPGPLVIKKLGETGDIRSAIGSLEFLCLKGEDCEDWGGTVGLRVKKATASSSILTKMETKSLEMVTRREIHLGIFHAIGKVVYNKREEVKTTYPNQELSAESSPHQAKPSISQVSLAQLLDESSTDTSTFIAALHENYVMSCQGTSFADSLNGCIDALSDSDLLSSDRRGRFNSIFLGGGFGRSTYQGSSSSDELRRDDISFHVAVQGVLSALPYPVQRRPLTIGVEGRNGVKRDAFKMFYPVSMKLSRQIEEVGSLIDRWASQYSTRLSLLAFSTAKSTSSAPSFPSSAKPSSPPWNDQPSTLNPSLTKDHPLLLIAPAKSDLVLDILPYVTAIERSHFTSPHLADLESITRFSGAEALANNDYEDEEEDDVKRGREDGQAKNEMQVPGRNARLNVSEKLWLSEDDIED